jgi:serine/threonine-protein kinase
MVDEESTRATRAEPGDPTADGKHVPQLTTAPASEHLADETIIPTWGAGELVALPDPGYQLGELIGRGGMGEVVGARDQRIGRDVAVKRIRHKQPSPDTLLRFLREARIQARLDHPAIVPVYELGTDGDGLPYFTMKRLAGETLAKKLAEGAPMQRLLRAFVDVCLAIRFAHARGVVHRDLKPSNIMLGDYGEVYVLDWGVARVLTDRRRSTHPGIADADLHEDHTTAGAILGTPGYMAPEQVAGLEVGPASDVYALGSILFEILAGESLHPRGDGALASTLTHPQAAPAARSAARAVPPELDGACFEALAKDPAERPTARELADRVQAYLDGDRDLERRRVLAAEQLESAHAALASTDDDARVSALRHAGRALALDPTSAPAAELVTTLLVKPPERLPKDLVSTLEAQERHETAHRSKNAVWAYLSVFVFWAVIPFLEVRNWVLLLSFYALVLLAASASFRASRTGTRSSVSVLAINGAAILVFSRVSSEFVLTPIVTMAVMMWFAANPRLLAHKWLVMTWLVVVVLAPFALEVAGVLPVRWSIHDDALHTGSDFFYLGGRLEEVALVAGNLAFMVISAWFALTLHDERHHLQRQLRIQHWHLRHLLPEDAGPRRTMQE